MSTEPTVAYEELTVQCAEALRVRGMTQAAVCKALTLPRHLLSQKDKYFSLWLNSKPMPGLTTCLRRLSKLCNVTPQ